MNTAPRADIEALHDREQHEEDAARAAEPCVLDWASLGHELRTSADDAHDGDTPSVELAYQFLLDNPECFIDGDEWPADMPQVPNIELIAAYYRAI